ncbi:transmembrane channel-like [Arctopsyche grandis]|uniref:transmembrane channel-like n=1 Tax=Arctopsyche grandis TaxID=121162 RepID=UPI00406D9D92
MYIYICILSEECGEGSDDEDYSASISAIMMRRASTKMNRRGSRVRRPSSPFSLDPLNMEARRRSSAFTTSSAETTISIEESAQGVIQEQIFENIRLHKEVLKSVKQQPLEMKRKLRLVTQAKSYIKKHEGALQERLAKSKCSRDIFARFHILLATKLQHLRREAANWSNWLIPWELRIKEIESHFGSVVASYFTFLRWLFWVNLVISIVLIVFVVVPEMLTADYNTERKKMLPEERNTSTDFLTLWEFEGVLKYSPMFYGYYTNRDSEEKGGYRLPLAYFMTGLAVYIYSFVATLRKMAENSRMSKLSEKEDECVFSWKIFTGWDYMIGNTETAHNRTASIILGFKEALLEEAEKKKDLRNWKIIFQRIAVNICVILLLGISAYGVIMVVSRSNEPEAKNNWWRQNEITIVMSLISYIFPNFFELLGLFENYHPRRQLRIQLARIMVLNLLNLYSLIIALFGKINTMTNESQTENESLSFSSAPTTLSTRLGMTLSHQIETSTQRCFEIQVSCDPAENETAKNITVALMTIMMVNASTQVPYNPTTTSTQVPYNPTTSTQVPYPALSSTGSTPLVLSLPHYPTSTTYPTYEDYPDYNESTSTLSQNYTTEPTFDNFTSPGPFVSTTYDTDEDDDDDGEYEYEPINEDNLDSSLSIVYPDSAIANANVTTEDYYDSSFHSVSISQRPRVERAGACYKTVCNSSVNTLVTIPEKLDSIPSSGRIHRDDHHSKKLCWETMFGQELVKLTVMDLLLTMLATLFMDFIRAVFIRHMNSCWCWDLEKKFPQYGDFKIAENILHLVNNQGMVWMGMFFSPGLVALNLIKLVILVYLRSWAVMTCNVPHEVVFRASRSNNFYLALLLTMLFLCVLPVGYAIVWLTPSKHCGPFSNCTRIYHLFTHTLLKILPNSCHRALDYIASPGIVIPLLVLLILIIYYLLSLTGALREANNDLKIQLRRERTEERRKMFQLADRRRRGGSSHDSETTPFSKWKKIMPILPVAKTQDKTIDAPPTNDNEKKDMLARIVKLALRKSSGTSGEESGLAAPVVDDETDTEFHESLPEDVLTGKDIKFTPKSKSNHKTTNGNSIKPEAKAKLHRRAGEAEPEVATRPANLVLENETVHKSRKKKADEKRAISEDEPTCSGDNKTNRVTAKAKGPPSVTCDPNRNDQKSNKRSRPVSMEKREDSVTSIIPVITISKTESDENILDKEKEALEEKGKSSNNDKVLKRQSSVESSRSVNIPIDKHQ